MYYGYRCYNKNGEDQGWLYTAQAEQELNPTKNPDSFHWCKRWKTERGAQNNFDYYNSRWQSYTKGGYLKIEVMPEIQVEQNADKVKESQSKDDENISVWNLEFKEEDEDILGWLNEQRLDDESNQELVMRKLRQLMNFEQQGINVVQIDLIRELLDPYDSTRSKCDFLTHLCSTVLTKYGIPHQPMVGTLTYEKLRIPVHWWIDLPNGFRVDYRARMSLGTKKIIPHGIFKPQDYQKVVYEGKAIELEPLHPVVLDAFSPKFNNDETD